eukprot:3967466-Heterocapsa_arctica.AAC.1
MPRWHNPGGPGQTAGTGRCGPIRCYPRMGEEDVSLTHVSCGPGGSLEAGGLQEGPNRQP